MTDDERYPLFVAIFGACRFKGYRTHFYFHMKKRKLAVLLVGYVE